MVTTKTVSTGWSRACSLFSYGCQGVRACARETSSREGAPLPPCPMRVLGLGVDPGAPGSYTGPYMLGSGSYHVRNNNKQQVASR